MNYENLKETACLLETHERRRQKIFSESASASDFAFLVEHFKSPSALVRAPNLVQEVGGAPKLRRHDFFCGTAALCFLAGSKQHNRSAITTMGNIYA
jgi:hypothetical protein